MKLSNEAAIGLGIVGLVVLYLVVKKSSAGIAATDQQPGGGGFMPVNIAPWSPISSAGITDPGIMNPLQLTFNAN